MHARDLIRRLVPRWLDARQALALSSLCMAASEAVWDIYEDQMHRYITGRPIIDDPVPDFGRLEPPPCGLDDLPF